ncbi:single-stranded DNA-binding protein [Bacillus mobilis]
MSLPNLTVTARLVDAPEIKWSQSGTAIAKLRLVSNSRRKNPQTDQWEDGDTWWGRGTAFARTAEAIAEANLQKGDLVTVRGEIKTDQWEKDGQKRSADEVIIREIGRALTPPRQQQSGGGFAANGSYGQQSGGFSGGQQQDDPWGQGGKPGFPEDQPPF